jgi:flagellar hook-associated protein FlgK
VDVNEESANLVRFQAAYQASAQISGIIDQLMQVTINMVPAA